MNREQLEKIRTVFVEINSGISNPIKINEAYSYLPNVSAEVPIRAKLVAIQRFGMLSLQDTLNEIIRKENEVIPEPKVFTESYDFPEELHKQSHKDDYYSHVNPDEDLTFLTKEEKENLKSNVSGTQMEIIAPDGRVKRRGNPNFGKK